MGKAISEYQNVNFRMERAIKNELDEVLTEIGLNTSTAFNMFARLIIRERGIPFPVIAKSDAVVIEEARKAIGEIREAAVRKGIDDISMEEIDEEIALYRKEQASTGTIKL
jgi:DNA-damage-inducible protein J